MAELSVPGGTLVLWPGSRWPIRDFHAYYSAWNNPRGGEDDVGSDADPARGECVGDARGAPHAPLRDVPTDGGAVRARGRQGPARHALPHGRPDGRARPGG